MKQTTLKLKTVAFGSGAVLLAFSMLVSSLMFAPNNASAFWWPWGEVDVHAQGNSDDDTVVVTIHKYIDGEPATSARADGNAFSMSASWDDPEGVGEGSGTFELSADTSPAYKAVTSELQVGADYTVQEVLDDTLVGAQCDDDHAYALVGYSVGRTVGIAANADVSDDAPSLTNLSKNQHVIVWNESCDDDDDTATSTGSISGQVTGGSSDDEDPGNLVVTSIDAQKTTATANGEFEDGWHYVFNITVPTDEPELAMKFMDWTHTGNDDHTIPVAGNMRISSEQADDDGTVTLSATNTYSSPALHITGDLDDEEDGMQVQVLVEVAVPSGTYNGTYSTEYGVRTLQ